MKTTAAALLVIASMTAQADEPNTLTLTCQGTVTGKGTAEGKSELISIGVIVDFTARTVQGFGYPVRSDRSGRRGHNLRPL